EILKIVRTETDPFRVRTALRLISEQPDEFKFDYMNGPSATTPERGLWQHRAMKLIFQEDHNRKFKEPTSVLKSEHERWPGKNPHSVRMMPDLRDVDSENIARSIRISDVPDP